MTSTSANLKTPLGTLIFSVIADRDMSSADEVSVEIITISPELPLGMSVESCSAGLLSARFSAPIATLQFLCQWEHAANRGDPNSGEGLDAQSWEDDNHIVMVGTEDADFLSARLPSLQICIEDEPVEYLSDGFSISLPRIPAHRPISLQFVVATNLIPESVDDSVWFAVDIPHARLLEKAKG